MQRVVGEENQMLLCPYNKSHCIRMARMQVHLVKCRRNHPGAELAQCPFNVSHHVNKVELDFHVKICPERRSLEYYLMKDEPLDESFGNRDSNPNESTGNYETASLNGLEEESSKAPESWDDEPDVPSYDPTEYLNTSKVLRQPRGLTPSERRAFRLKERERLQKNPNN